MFFFNIILVNYEGIATFAPGKSATLQNSSDDQVDSQITKYLKLEAQMTMTLKRVE